jgi:hypothetical protein
MALRARGWDAVRKERFLNFVPREEVGASAPVTPAWVGDAKSSAPVCAGKGGFVQSERRSDISKGVKPVVCLWESVQDAVYNLHRNISEKAKERPG